MELCARLPWWEGWLGPALALVVELVFGLPAFWLVLVRAKKRLGEPTLHWTERARAAAELKSTTFAIGLTSIVGVLFLSAVWESGSGCSHFGVGSALGAVVMSALWFRTNGRIEAAYQGRAPSVGARLRSLLTIVVVFQPGIVVASAAVYAGQFAPRDGWIWAWVAAVGVIHVFTGSGILYRLAPPLGLAWPARAEVERAVERARRDLPTPVRRVDELAWLMPNAMVLPLFGTVAFTKTAAETLSEDELHAIALHELGHLHESKLARFGRPLRSLFWLPASVAVPFISGERVTALLVLSAASLALTVLSTRLSRHHEKEADAHAVAHSQGYARALEKLYEMAGIPAVLSKRSTHPSLYDRMLAAGVTPDFPRPSPPRRYRSFALAIAAELYLFAAMLGMSIGRLLADPILGRECAALVRVAVQGSPSDLIDLAHETRDRKLTQLLYDRAVSEEPELRNR